ncbi:hypothetical protein [Okeania sp. SIO2B3]|uniref:hypothetical protein n=1 Tax=Okeania sp. SIO2B3 TaxID=2607784 RepID=UPI0013C12655|nr:hypothetical protein [Okeania sp. SIO2B3]NET41511.1 hypothetical protein [Okeania sp. SIO2B3]
MSRKASSHSMEWVRCKTDYILIIIPEMVSVPSHTLLDRHTLSGALDGGMGRWGDGEIKTPRNKNL